MKSPLRKRLPRELKGEIGKYLVVLILMIATIGFVSGFLVADGSMIKAYNEGFEKYKIEDGNFRVKKKITKAQQENIEKNGVTLYETFIWKRHWIMEVPCVFSKTGKRSTWCA